MDNLKEPQQASQPTQIQIPQATQLTEDLNNVKRAQSGSPTYNPYRFVEQFYFEDDGTLWVNIATVWREITTHWNFISTTSGNGVTVPAGTNFIICESETGLNGSNVGGHGQVTLSRDYLSATFTSLSNTAGEQVSFTATWDLNAMTVSTGLSGTFHFYT